MCHREAPSGAVRFHLKQLQQMHHHTRGVTSVRRVISKHRQGGSSVHTDKCKNSVARRALLSFKVPALIRCNALAPSSTISHKCTDENAQRRQPQYSANHDAVAPPYPPHLAAALRKVLCRQLLQHTTSRILLVIHTDKIQPNLCTHVSLCMQVN